MYALLFGGWVGGGRAPFFLGQALSVFETAVHPTGAAGPHVAGGDGLWCGGSRGGSKANVSICTEPQSDRSPQPSAWLYQGPRTGPCHCNDEAKAAA